MLKKASHIMAGITMLCSLAIGTPFALFIGTGAIIAVLLFYKGE
jgi:ABC-type spermidine/putrescine transport system permease subunit I